MESPELAVKETNAGANVVKPDTEGLPCRGCDTSLSPVKITCIDGRTELDPPEVNVVQGTDVRWTALFDDQETAWTVTFHKSPAEDGVTVFNQDNSHCVIGDVPAGRYHYSARLEVCGHAARGSVEVVIPGLD
jgi:hypothetical protein